MQTIADFMQLSIPKKSMKAISGGCTPPKGTLDDNSPTRKKTFQEMMDELKYIH